MRRSLPVIALLLATAACSQSGDDLVMENQMGSGEPAVEDVSERSAPDNFEARNSSPPSVGAEPAEASDRVDPQSGPDVRPTTAPGVAFDYRYAFRLAADRVAEAQQEHQRICEGYGVARCRITGMVYRAQSDEDVEAMLSFRVDPAIAGRFGREGVEAVIQAEGELTDSEITGNDVAKSIDTARRDLPRLEAELARIEQQLGRQNIGREERARLEYEAQMLRQQIRDLQGSREAAEQSLATTPMLFRYGSGSLAPGFARPPTVAEALEDAGDDFKASLSLLLVILVRLSPWAALGLIGWGLYRLVRRRLRPAARPVVGASPEVSV